MLQTFYSNKRSINTRLHSHQQVKIFAPAQQQQCKGLATRPGVTHIHIFFLHSIPISLFDLRRIRKSVNIHCTEIHKVSLFFVPVSVFTHRLYSFITIKMKYIIIIIAVKRKSFRLQHFHSNYSNDKRKMVFFFDFHRTPKIILN